jgi:IS30 family transposase
MRPFALVHKKRRKHAYDSEIMEMHHEGKSCAQIGRELGLTRQFVHRVIKRIEEKQKDE